MIDPVTLFAAFEHSPVPVSLTRASDGRYAQVNAAWCRLIGYSPSEAIGHTSIELGVWVDTAHRRDALDTLAKAGKATDIAFYVRARDGSIAQVLMNGSVIDIGGQAHFLLFLRDATAEHAARAALVASEAALKALNDQLHERLAIYELTESLARVGHWYGTKEGGFSHWSPSLYALMGLKEGSVSTREQARAPILEEDQHIFTAARGRMDDNTVEFRFRRVDGTVRWARSSSRRRYVDGVHASDFGVILDVTDEKVAQLALQEQLDFIRKVTSRLPNMVFQYALWPDGTNTFPFASDAIVQMFRVTPEQARANGALVINAVHPQDLQRLRESLDRSALDLSHWSHEFRVLFPDGTVNWLHGSSNPEREANGVVVWYGSIRDITLEKIARDKHHESEDRFRSLTALSSDWYWEQDLEHRHIDVKCGTSVEANERVAEAMGKTRWEVGALNLSEQDWEQHRAALKAHETFRDFEIERKDPQGKSFWLSLSGMPRFDVDGVFLGYRGIGRYITARKHAEQKIERLAFYDALTGLPNRRLLLDRLHMALLASERNRQTGALLFIDLDNFKDLNDTRGHDVGDLLLIQVGQRLRSSVREMDTVARLGGDEFVVMLEGLGSARDESAAMVDLVANKILHTLNLPYRFEATTHHSTPSIGVTLFNGHQDSIDELLKRADLAMYQAKSAGRNTVRYFNPAMQVAVSLRASIEADLRQGLGRDELVLFYQPIVDIQSQVTGFEALVRWRHPQRGLILPGEFIGLAEQTDLIVPLGEWVLRAALAQLVVWNQAAQTRALTMSINISARQFRSPNFVPMVLGLLRASGANPHRLKLELTESLLLADAHEVVVKMTELRGVGVSFALDDFGTGYSSLSYLKRLPLDQLKIDQSFVRDVLTDVNDAAIARMILALASHLDMEVIAEGVETEGQREFLAKNGCRAFQGYLFGRPAPIAKIQSDIDSRAARSQA